jgi:hypothetical protein
MHRPRLAVLLTVGSLLFVDTARADPLRWSWRSDKVGVVTVFGSYPNPDDPDNPDADLFFPWFEGEYGGGNLRIAGLIPAIGDAQPTDKRVVFETDDDDPVLMEVALVGTIGSFTRVPLAQAILATIGNGEYDTPMFGAPGEELFIGVDLFQYLLAPPSFDLGDVFTFVNGTNPEFPGLVIGRSPIVVSSATGLTVTDPFTGAARVIGISDGAVIPEPATSALLGTGLVSLLVGGGVSRLRRRG